MGPSNFKPTYGAMYMQNLDTGETVEFNPINNVVIEHDELPDCFIADELRECAHSGSFSFRVTHKEYFKKKRNGRYVRYYKTVDGLDPKLIKHIKEWVNEVVECKIFK